MKTAVRWIVSAVVLAVASWTVTYLFWHIRIVGAVRTLESKAGTPAAEEAADIVDSAGCRALPYLLGALDYQQNQPFQILVSKSLFSSIEFLASQSALPDPALVERARAWIILPEDGAPEIRAKCDALLAYWREHGRLHHKTSRVWTSKCVP